jgi:branched-chain amino acid transport system ATP-binding protein
MNQPVLSVDKICKSFGGIQAVNHVSFDVQPGEVLGLIGPNGSGKSTLFNCILGQLIPDSGSVRVNGRSVSGKRACELNKLGVARTFQQLQVFPGMTVLENIILAGQEHQGTMLSRLFGAPDAGLTEEADRLIAFFRLSHLRDEMAGSLSYGQQKLVDAAMAFMAGPSLVLLDEPAGGVNLTMLAHRTQHGICHVSLYPDSGPGQRCHYRRRHARGDPEQSRGHRRVFGGLTHAGIEEPLRRLR